MSVYVDNFIKQHREYFKRNESFIENNNWNDTRAYKQQLEHLKREFKDVTNELDGDDLKEEQQRITDEIINLGSSSQKKKKELFNQEKQIAKSILTRLSVFISRTEKSGDRSLKKVQDFVEFAVDILSKHIMKCDLYLDYNMDVITDDDDKQIEYKGQEITFQDEIFKAKIDVQDRLDSMNIESSTDNIEISFFRDAKASLVLKEPLVHRMHQVADKTENLSVDWNVVTSNEMFINMKKKDIPRWNPNKHYFDQDPVVLQFWAEEYKKIQDGITIGGYFIHPWLYFHLNFFKTPIPQEDSTEPIVNPTLRDNEWFFTENLKNCLSDKYPGYYDKAMLVYGTRRFAKSVILASLAHWRTLTKHNSVGTIVGGSSSDLGSLTSKIQTSMDYIERPFKLDPVKQNWSNGVTPFGIKTDQSNSIIFSNLLVQNLEQGTKKSATQKTAGLAPSVSIYDEIGKYPFKKPYLAALPSFATPYGFKCVTVLAGTGGEADLSTDAMSVLSNPEGYDLLPMDWDLLENKLDPERITWKRRKFATFFPGQMAYEKGFIKKKENFGDFLGIDDPDLNKIKIDVSDWESNEKYLKQKVEDAKKEKGKDGKLLEQQRKVQYPLDPEDCFMTAEGNPFPTKEAQKKRQFLRDNEIEGRKVFLERDKQNNNKIFTIDASEKDLPDFPYAGGFIDSPIVIYEEPNNAEFSKNLYIAGLDDYNIEESDGDSVGSFTIYKRNIMDGSSDRVVATYNARPDPHRKFHKQGELLLEFYNAKCYMENADTKFIDHLNLKHKAEFWLVPGFDPGSEYTFNTSNRRKYGWMPTPANIKYMMGRLIEYCDEDIPIYDEEGNIERVMKGVERIDDIGILEEIINYKADGNFDRLRSFGSCLMYDLYLTTTYQSASVQKQYDEEELRRRQIERIKKSVNRNSLFPRGGKSGFF